MGELLLDEYSSFNMIDLFSLSKVDWNLYLISVAKPACIRIGVLIGFIEILSPKFVLFFS